ncbi:hypothetical protein VTN31DRAFT_3686 [Thermomyces dupontii]|uniref:uncharacterized protein n=1 Tax=Talaromyces thermophilus TaxID=28565 RepID=UPI003743C8A0
MDWLTLIVPFAYLGVLIGCLATFSSLYRRRKAAKAASLEPWFPPHLQRDIYNSLLHLDQQQQDDKKTRVPETVLKAALLRRAAEDIKRVMAIREQKQALALLLQRGSVGDELWQRFLRAEKEMEDEVRDVVAEANAYAPNWGQVIFQSAREMDANATYRARMEEYQSSVAEERAWWDRKRASIQEGFMKELDAAEKERPATAASTATATTTTTTTTASDDDAVLVEAEKEATSSPAPGKKKKKGKK